MPRSVAAISVTVASPQAAPATATRRTRRAVEPALRTHFARHSNCRYQTVASSVRPCFVANAARASAPDECIDFKVSAVAIPDGNGRPSSLMSCRLSGIAMKTPSSETAHSHAIISHHNNCRPVAISGTRPRYFRSAHFASDTLALSALCDISSKILVSSASAD